MSKDIIPSNILAEENVLGSILLEEEQLSRIDLEPADFIEEKHQIIFKAMLDLYKDGGGIDQVTVSHKLHKDGNSERIGSAILSHFIAITPTSLHAVHYAKIIKECSLNRSLISAASKISQIGFGNKDPGESLAESQKLLSGISRSMPSTKIWTPQDMAEEANKRYGKLRDTIPGIPTGLKLFDKMTGGLFNGDYILLGARPSIGKTTLAAQIAIHISDNLHALFVSLEMTKDSVIDKVVAHLIGKPASLIRRGNYNEDLLSDITLSLGEIASKNLYLSCGPTSTKSLRQIIERMKLSYGVDVVFVDYLQYLRDREGNSDNERIGFISGELANMAKEFNIPFIVLSQLNRELEKRADKRPLLSDLRSSGSLEQDADMIIFLSRESYYNHSLNPHGAEAELIIAKTRIGVTGKLSLYWDAKREVYCNTLREVTDERQGRLKN